MATPETARVRQRAQPLPLIREVRVQPPRISRVVFMAIAFFITFLALMPFVLTVSGSLKTPSEN